MRIILKLVLMVVLVVALVFLWDLNTVDIPTWRIILGWALVAVWSEVDFSKKE